MQKDKHITEIVFRVNNNKSFIGSPVFALFPYEISHGYYVTSYQHVGQHSSADYNHCVQNSKLATESEYKDLLSEMESLGYNINPIKKRNYDKYLKSYYEARK